MLREFSDESGGRRKAAIRRGREREHRNVRRFHAGNETGDEFGSLRDDAIENAYDVMSSQRNALKRFCHSHQRAVDTEVVKPVASTEALRRLCDGLRGGRRNIEDNREALCFSECEAL